MASENKYSIEMIWSEEDGLYLSTVRELPGCLADGETPDEALKNIQIVMQEWLETAREEGREIPKPFTLEFLQKTENAANASLQLEFERRVREAVAQFFRHLGEQQTLPNIPSWRDRGQVVSGDPKFGKAR